MHRYIARWLIVVAPSFLLLVSCCDIPEVSKLDGHFEDFNEELLLPLKNQQSLVPEYADADSVLISLPLLTIFKKESLVQKILTSGINTIYVAVSHDYSGTIGHEDFSTLRKMLGDRINQVKILRQNHNGPVSVWARDWAPISTVSNDGQLRLVDFNYYSHRPADDGTALSLAKSYGIDRLSLPVYNEGGNFMANSRGECFLSNRVTESNRYPSYSGDPSLSEDEVVQYFKDYLACQSVEIFPRLPIEQTGHIDMWAKFVDDDTVLISEIMDETLRSTRGRKTVRKATERIRDFLEEQSSRFEDLGYRVLRVPMPAPTLAPQGFIIRSYTNSLIVRGQAIIPRYIESTQYSSQIARSVNRFTKKISPKFLNKIFRSIIKPKYLDQWLLDSYERKVASAYENAGYQTSFIDSDQLIAYGGSIHCVTMQLGIQ